VCRGAGGPPKGRALVSFVGVRRTVWQKLPELRPAVEVGWGRGCRPLVSAEKVRADVSNHWRNFLKSTETAELAEIEARIVEIDAERLGLLAKRRKLRDRACARRSDGWEPTSDPIDAERAAA